MNTCHRCGHPAQQQGRRIPSKSSSRVLLILRLRVSGFLAEITQQINSFRANGVISSQADNAVESDTSVFRRSGGNLCTAPEDTLIAVMFLLYIKLFDFSTFQSCNKNRLK